MPFIDLHIEGEIPIVVNTDHILFAQPNGSRTRINWANGGHLTVQEPYAQVSDQMPKYEILSAVEITEPSIAKAVLGNQQSDDESEKARQAEEVARTEQQQAAADAKAADAKNPAKSRETK